jgi:putative hydrolase of the HAD superfamily
MTYYKAILLDIDNTLYDYKRVHELASKLTFEKIGKTLDISTEIISSAYSNARKYINTQLEGTASSHNRLLYFQIMLEELHQPSVSIALDFYKCYWNTFVDNIILFEGVLDFLEKHGDKICFLTDLTADVQFLKISRWKLDRFGAKLFTSEECGREKPSQAMFLGALNKLGTLPSEAVMIGDNYKKDILGALSLGIDAIMVNNSNAEPKSEVMVAGNFEEVNKFIK